MKILIVDDTNYFKNEKDAKELRYAFDGLREKCDIAFCVGASTNSVDVMYASNSEDKTKGIDELINTADLIFMDLLWTGDDMQELKNSIMHKIMHKVRETKNTYFAIYTARGQEEAIRLSRELKQKMGEQCLGYYTTYVEDIGNEFAEAIKHAIPKCKKREEV